MFYLHIAKLYNKIIVMHFILPQPVFKFFVKKFS